MMDEGRLRYRGLAYDMRRDGVWLTVEQARYALARLWERVAGDADADWEGEPAIVFSAATRAELDALLDHPDGALPRVALVDVLPPGAAPVPFDTDRLPALCRVGNPDAPSPSPLRHDGAGAFPLDLPAAVYLLLTRWEDVERGVRDELGRFKEGASLAVRQGFDDRPVLDEWGWVLRQWLLRARPGWEPRLPESTLWMTHDMDVPYRFTGLKSVIRRAGGRLLRHKSPARALAVLGEWRRARRDFHDDPFYRGALDLMDLDEELGLRGTFFFMAARPGPLDRGYDLSVHPYRTLLDEILARGHEVGWHVGFAAGADAEVYAAESDRIDALLPVSPFGVRHHYLNWRGWHHWRALADGGRSFDTSCGYTRRVGFRCGTSRPYPVFDPERGRELALAERPLIVMDGGLCAQCPDGPARIERIALLRDRARRVGGEFTVLIHNDFNDEHPGSLAMFRQALSSTT